jgi:hypothetical protein
MPSAVQTTVSAFCAPVKLFYFTRDVTDGRQDRFFFRLPFSQVIGQEICKLKMTLAPTPFCPVRFEFATSAGVSSGVADIRKLE